MARINSRLARAGVIISVDGIRDAVSWCKQMCAGEWYMEPCVMDHARVDDRDLSCSFVFFFTRRIDGKMFENAYKNEMQTANQQLIQD